MDLYRMGNILGYTMFYVTNISVLMIPSSQACENLKSENDYHRLQF